MQNAIKLHDGQIGARLPLPVLPMDIEGIVKHFRRQFRPMPYVVGLTAKVWAGDAGSLDEKGVVLSFRDQEAFTLCQLLLVPATDREADATLFVFPGGAATAHKVLHFLAHSFLIQRPALRDLLTLTAEPPTSADEDAPQIGRPRTADREPGDPLREVMEEQLRTYLDWRLKEHKSQQAAAELTGKSRGALEDYRKTPWGQEIEAEVRQEIEAQRTRKGRKV